MSAESRGAVVVPWTELYKKLYKFLSVKDNGKGLYNCEQRCVWQQCCCIHGITDTRRQSELQARLGISSLVSQIALCCKVHVLHGTHSEPTKI